MLTAATNEVGCRNSILLAQKAPSTPADRRPMGGRYAEVPDDRLFDVGGQPGVGLRTSRNVRALRVPWLSDGQRRYHRDEWLDMAGFDHLHCVAAEVEGLEDARRCARLARQRHEDWEPGPLLAHGVVLRRQPHEHLLCGSRDLAVHGQDADPALTAIRRHQLSLVGDGDRGLTAARLMSQELIPRVVEQVRRDSGRSPRQGRRRPGSVRIMPIRSAAPPTRPGSRRQARASAIRQGDGRNNEQDRQGSPGETHINSTANDRARFRDQSSERVWVLPGHVLGASRK